MLHSRTAAVVCRVFQSIGDKNMKPINNALLSAGLVAIVMSGLAVSAAAQGRSQREVRDAVMTLSSQIDDLAYELEYQGKNGGLNPALQNVQRRVSDLKDKVASFDQNVTQRRENRDDIYAIVDAARSANKALGAANTDRSVRGYWADVKRSVDSLAAKYGVTPDWNSAASTRPNAPAMSTPVRASVSGLTGTYQLDAAKSEKITDVLASSRVGAGQRQDLESKLEAPEEIAILVSGNRVTLASSKAEPVSFIADGRDKAEDANGKTIRVRATLRGQDLTISSVGGETDYTVRFVSIDGGNAMKVTRRITTDYLRETVFAESVYTKSDAVAGLGIDNMGAGQDDTGDYSSNDPNDTTAGGSAGIVTQRIGEFIVPNGTSVAAVLENPIDTKVSQNNDRFRLTVQSPDEFRGAVIEGYITGVGRSGQVSGRSNVTFNFTKITLRDGKEYDFAGTLTSIKEAYGKEVKVDTEGTAKGDSQTKESVKRGGIGAGAGALIGAILGGGKGAVIGAVIGGGAGAGSVIAQGRTDVKLAQGSVLTIASSSPQKREQPMSEN